MLFDPKSLKFNSDGLLPVIVQDNTSRDVLMLAWMNAEAVAQTLATGKVTYWSRSRQRFWVKGESSGHTQQLVDLRFDCDRDCILVLVNQIGPACHTNRENCFFTSVITGDEVILTEPLL